MRPSDAAAWALVESLLGCYGREVAGPAGALRFEPPGADGDQHLLVIDLPHSGRALLVRVSGLRLTLNLRYHPPVSVQEEGAWQPLHGYLPVVQLLLAELRLRLGCEPHAELRSLIDDSVQVQERILAAWPAVDDAAQPFPRRQPVAGAAGRYIAAEQALREGHPFHPSPKSRVGFTPSDHQRYSPELGVSFVLHRFAVRQELLIDESLEPGASAAALIGEDAPPGYAVVPVHPYQVRVLGDLPALRAAEERGDVIDLGPGGPLFYPTASVRTLFSPALPYFYKTSLSVRVTNCLRRQAVHEMQASLLVTAVLRERGAALARFPALDLWEEPAFLSVALPGSDGLPDRRVSEAFGLLLRRTFASHNDPDEQQAPLLCAALFGNREVGQRALRVLLDGIDREAFFAGYVHLLLPPLLHLFAAEGVMLEAHLQNVLVTLRNGMPVRVHLRDFDNARLCAPRGTPPWLQSAPARAREELLLDGEPAWQRLCYCLFTNHLCDAVAALSEGREALAVALFRLLRDELRSCRAAVPPAAPYLDRLLAGEPWPAKNNLLTRFRKTPDRDAAYSPLPSPLAPAAQALP